LRRGHDVEGALGDQSRERPRPPG